MRIGLNLSSDPFRRNRPALIAWSAGLLALFCSLLALIFIATNDKSAIRRDQGTADRLTRDMTKLKADQRGFDQEIRKTENAEVLERSVFLNQLLLRKGISWTRIFADLEKTLPSNVRITQIRPQVNSDNQIFLEMTVAADSPEPMVLFVSRLEQSEFFGSANVSTYQAPSQTDPFYRYRLSVNYAQKL